MFLFIHIYNSPRELVISYHIIYIYIISYPSKLNDFSISGVNTCEKTLCTTGNIRVGKKF